MAETVAVYIYFVVLEVVEAAYFSRIVFRTSHTVGEQYQGVHTVGTVFVVVGGFHTYGEGCRASVHVLKVEWGVLEFDDVRHIEPFQHFLNKGDVESVGLSFIVDE